MERYPRTKTALLAAILSGPAYVSYTGGSTYRLGVHGDPPDGGVWITFLAEETFVIADHPAAYAQLRGKRMRLTRAEADAIAALVARTMRKRKRRWRFA